MRNLRKRYVFFAGGVPVLLWKTPPEEFLAELRARLQNMAALTKERLRADFPRNDVRSALAVFDRRTVIKGFGPLPSSETRRMLLRGVRQLAKLLGREERAAELQYTDVLDYMIKQWAPAQPLAGKNEPGGLGAPSRRWGMGGGMPQQAPSSLWRVAPDHTLLHID